MTEMIAGVVLGSLFLLLVLALHQRVWIRVVWGPDSWSIEVRYLLLRLRGPRKHRKREEKRKRRKTSVLQWVRLVPELLRALGKGLGFLIRHSQLRHLRLEGTIGTEDPATTGIVWGSIQAFRGLLPCASKLELTIAPDFVEQRISLTLGAEGVVRMAVVLTTITIALWYIPKRRLWSLLRDKSRKAKKSTSPHARSKEVKVV
jgi:hypothetical protein